MLEERQIQCNIALQQNSQDRNRIQRVAFPLLQAAVLFCDANLKASIELDVATGYDFEEFFQRSARAVLSASVLATVIGVVEGGPSSAVGLKLKDTIIAVNNNPIVTARNDSAIYNNLLDEELLNDVNTMVTVNRTQKRLNAS